MSADFPNEAARCQRFLSEGAQSNFEPRGQNGPAATRSPCYLMENTRSKDRVRGKNSVNGLWLSLVERLVRDQEAVGSNPTSPMKTV